MPNETHKAINWSLQRGIKASDRHNLVEHVRRYFNENDIEYSTFSYVDLEPFLN